MLPTALVVPLRMLSKPLMGKRTRIGSVAKTGEVIKAPE